MILFCLRKSTSFCYSRATATAPATATISTSTSTSISTGVRNWFRFLPNMLKLVGIYISRFCLVGIYISR